MRQIAGEIRGVETGRVRAGIAYPAYYPALTEAVSGFSRVHPGVEIEIRSRAAARSGAVLESGERRHLHHEPARRGLRLDAADEGQPGCLAAGRASARRA